MGRKGRPQKPGKRRNGRPVVDHSFDRGSEWVQAQRNRFGEHYGSALGRAYAAGLLGDLQHEGALAKDRDRQNRRRSREVTECHVTARDNAENPPPPLSPQTPQTPPPPCNNKPARKGTRLPADWQPKPLPSELAAAVGSWPEGAERREQSRFRDWAASATGPNAIKTDWDAAWRNWLRKAEDEGRYGRRNATAPPGGSDPLVASILAKQARQSAESTAP